MASEAAAQQGYEDATIAVPPPLPGSTARSLRLSRPEPSVVELQERLVGLLAVMDLEIEPATAAEWAQEVHPSVRPGDETSIAEPLPGVVVTYDPRVDDLAVVNTVLLEDGIGQQVDKVPWLVASTVMDALVDRGLIDRSLSLDEAEVSFVRSGIKGPDGSHEQWVDEIRFEANAHIDGTLLLDAGLRIGITPAQSISSLRVTRIEIEPLDPIVIETSDVDLRDSFAAHVVESTGATVESVRVTERRPVYLLEPEALSAVIEPQYMVRYSIVTNSDDTLMGSRATMAFLSLTSPSPLVELQLP